jgi:hypothetical protein
MADNFNKSSNDVSRTIPTENTQFTNVIWQSGKPPLDSELNLIGQLSDANQRLLASAQAHSGFLIDPRTTERDYSFDSKWSNLLKIKAFKALVAGSVVNVGEKEIKLPPPPETGARTDFVFLEVWRSLISAQGGAPDTTLLQNKPSTSTIYANGDVEGSDTLDDNMIDSNVMFETTKRVQIQYQFRVVSGIDLKSHPEGLSSTLIYAHGPTAGEDLVNFTPASNGDVGLWVAEVSHDTLSENTIYAIPVCAVFRRNEQPYVDRSPNLNGASNQNGAVNRKPSSTTSDDATILTQATLSSLLTPTTSGAISLSDFTESGIDADLFSGVSERFFIVGEGVESEIIAASGVTQTGITISQRGVGGTQAKRHEIGAQINLYNNRPDGKYADQVHRDDLMDMRHATTLGEWDYQSILEGAVSDVLLNRMRSVSKQNSINSDCRGPVIEEVSYLSSASANQTHQLDFPNGFRDTWSDASIPQMGISIYVDPDVALTSAGAGTTLLNVDDQENWEIGPDLEPSGKFLFNDGTKVKAGSIITLTLNSDSGNLNYGLSNSQGVRFLAPREIGTLNQDKRPPVTIEQLGEDEYTFHSYPTEGSNYERPFMVLGRSLFNTTVSTTALNHIRLFKSSSYSEAGNDPTSLDQLIAFEIADVSLLPSDFVSRVNQLGEDYSGDRSALYVMVYGDPDNPVNNGVFKVIDISPKLGADSTGALLGGGAIGGYFSDDQSTLWTPADPTNWIVLKPVDNIEIDRDGLTFGARTPIPGVTLTLDFRVQEITHEDTEIAIAITESNALTGQLYTNNPFQISVSVMYPPSIGGTANVADQIHKIGLTPTNKDNYLRNVPSDLDPTNATTLPLTAGEIPLPTKSHISLWNRLPSANLLDGWASADQLGGRIVSEEVDRESEVFKDEGSKTLVLRPFQRKRVICHPINPSSRLFPQSYVAGHDVDAEGLFLTQKGYKLPEALVPRFGRQDIPLHQRTSTSDSFMNGLNHVFLDKTSNSDGVFSIIGGLPTSAGSSAVYPLLLDTATTYGRADAVFPNGVKVIGARKRHASGNVGNKTNALAVPTSDFGAQLQGIELPPYYGVARVYGVYHRDDYETWVSGNGISGGHNTLRDTPISNVQDLTRCPNLLRTDASDFTLYINQGGGNEDVGQTEAHTYILTEHAIDITRSPSYTGTETFSDFDFIVELVVFGFAEGFISSNRYVMMRQVSGAGINLTNVSNRLVIDCVLPFAPSIGSDVSVAYKRTVYQGDPYYTKSISLLDDSDQTIPYGPKSVADLELGTRDQTLVQINNRRNLQVLASLDFYTTLGTGKMGGALYPTTITDVGHALHTPFRDISGYTSTYPELGSSAFTSREVHGGFVSIFMLEGSYGFTFNIERTGRSTISYEFTQTAVDYGMRVSQMMDAFKSFGYDSIQIMSGSYYGVILREPFAGGDATLEVTWTDGTWDNKSRIGKEVQIFSGIREVHQSFNFQIAGGATTENFLNLSKRTLSKVSFSEVPYAPTNAGSGLTPISLVGMTSRLPLGSLVRDSDFICEDILNNQASYLFSSSGNISTLSSSVPVNGEGQPYSRSLGRAGDIIQMSEGSQNQNTPLAVVSTSYTISRGGGAVFGASGEVPGAPLSFLVSSINQDMKPVLKGSVLAGRAMLVKNFEERFLGSTRSFGEEIQLVIVTYCLDGATGSPISSTSNGLTIGGEISPTGYGEGFASADRYRVKGRPLVKSYSSDLGVTIEPAPYNTTRN